MKQPGHAAVQFQARAATTGKARSPIVVRHVDGTSRAGVSRAELSS